MRIANGDGFRYIEGWMRSFGSFSMYKHRNWWGKGAFDTKPLTVLLAEMACCQPDEVWNVEKTKYENMAVALNKCEDSILTGRKS